MWEEEEEEDGVYNGPLFLLLFAAAIDTSVSKEEGRRRPKGSEGHFHSRHSSFFFLFREEGIDQDGDLPNANNIISLIFRFFNVSVSSTYVHDLLYFFSLSVLLFGEIRCFSSCRGCFAAFEERGRRNRIGRGRQTINPFFPHTFLSPTMRETAAANNNSTFRHHHASPPPFSHAKNNVTFPFLFGKKGVPFQDFFLFLPCLGNVSYVMFFMPVVSVFKSQTWKWERREDV